MAQGTTIGEVVYKFLFEEDEASKKKVEKDVKNLGENAEKALMGIQKGAKNLLRAAGITVGLKGLFKMVQKFDGVSETITEIKKEWTEFGTELDKSLEIGKTISATFKEASTWALKHVKELTSKVQTFVKKIGGIQNVLKAILYLATAISSVKMLQKLFPSLTGVKAKALVGLLTILYLIIEDIYYFIQGKGSFLGDVLEEYGIDAADIKDMFKQIKDIGLELAKTIGKAFNIEGVDGAKSVVAIFLLMIEKLYLYIAEHKDEIVDMIQRIANAISSFFVAEDGDISPFEKLLGILEKIVGVVSEIDTNQLASFVKFLGVALLGLKVEKWRQKMVDLFDGLLGGSTKKAAAEVGEKVGEEALEGAEKQIAQKSGGGLLTKLLGDSATGEGASTIVTRLFGSGASGLSILAQGIGLILSLVAAFASLKNAIKFFKGEDVAPWFDTLTDKVSDCMLAIETSVKNAFNTVKEIIGNTKVGKWIGEKLGIEFDGTEGENEVQESKDEIESKLDTLSDDARVYGVDFSNNFASGIRSGSGEITAALDEGLIGPIQRRSKFSVPKEGPLHDQDKWGGHFVQNFVTGIKDALPTLENAVGKVSKTLAMNNNFQTATDVTVKAVNESTTPVNVTQNVNISNSFSGSDRSAQTDGAKVMNKASKDATNQMARAIKTAGAI